MGHFVLESSYMPSGGGEMGERIRCFDWSGTSCGNADSWPPALRHALGTCLSSHFPAALYWGPELCLFYNDGWAPLAGERHPATLGAPACDVWGDRWPAVGPHLDGVLTSGCGCAIADQHLPVSRAGRLEECYWDHGLTPILGDGGAVAGILCQSVDVTDRVFGLQRNALLIDLGDRLRTQDEEAAIVAGALASIGSHFGAARAGYGEIDLAGGTLNILDNWRRDESVGDLRGVHALGGFGIALHAALRTGAVVAICDTQADATLAGSAEARLYQRLGIRAGLVVPVLKGGEYAAAIFIHDDRPRSWTQHHERLLAGVAERIWQESRRARADRALRASEERYRLIFEQANDIIFTADLDQRITAANPAAGQALGRAPGDLEGRSIAEFLDPADFSRTSEMLRRKLGEGGTTRYEVDVQTGDGAARRWEINSSLARDDAGVPIGLHAIARDVSDRHALEAHQSRLINELNHRVKNMLALVQGLAQTSFRGDKPLAEAQASFQARLAALAAAHDLLTREKWEGATLGEIVSAVLRPYAAHERVAHGGPPVLLSPKTAVSLVMAFHELASNASRHGALSAESGHLTVVWDRTPDDRLRIEWRESGGPAVAPPQKRGFGLRMVERAVAADLAARVEIDFAASGLVCTVDAPLPVANAAPMPRLPA